MKTSRCAVYIGRNIHYHFLIINSLCSILGNWYGYVSNLTNFQSRYRIFM
uniref:Uncharacterized protein n=1 Tax=Podoviridae sp. ct8Lf7 TaxID=2827723 RepID=A0A8S5S0N1_9CAUD|nr:MAG TPA: hypothetical protein [Podoviridae sp. ct8Lf7]